MPRYREYSYEQSLMLPVRLADQLHPDFHHLNSSQAMCFNLFYPFVLPESPDINSLLDVLGVPRLPVVYWEFEHIADRVEFTNFDFFIRVETGTQLFFEVKLSEQRFGSPTPNARRRQKLETVYRPALQGKVDPELLDPRRFFGYYQLLRNVAYADPNGKAIVFFVSPRSNSRIRDELKSIGEFLHPSIRPAVRTIWVEDFVAAIRSNHVGDLLSGHFESFEEKYLRFV